MIELILANRIYDIGYVFDASWGGFVGLIANKYMDGKTNVASTKPNAFKKQMSKTLKKFDVDTD